ncbi:hypothetical protein I3900191A7_16450 [Clostridium baratii]|uniref:hypothetical protein n=1 Tax=Clostridium baratii TaxID=1561 RepID=UPI0036F2E53C
MEMVQNQLIELITIILGGLLSIATVYATIFINRAVQKAKIESSKIKDEQLQLITNNTLDKVNMLIQTNVVAMEQTVVKGIKEGIKDGKLTKKDLEAVAQEVKEKVLHQIGKDSMEILNNTLGDVNGYVESKIEFTLASLKEQI